MNNSSFRGCGKLWLWAVSLGASFSAAAAPLDEAIAQGLFQPSWESLPQHYQCPDWFRDAKFGIGAHWGPQCVPEQGDGYARNLYRQGSSQYEYHVRTYGHPSQVGFKDICRRWQAENFAPEKLIALYQRAGARYFVMMANHHCNFDNFASTYQPWNSVNIGPKKDLVGLWALAARKAGLRFGVSVHSGRAWNWYEPAQGSDATGPYAGVPYDGKLTKADGRGQWWEGLDPQDLYAQNHAPGAPPDSAYVNKFFLRTRELIDQYQPDLLYFDDSVMPLGNAENVGLRLTAHLYNSSRKWHGGRNEAVVTAKQLQEDQRRALVWDIERGRPDRLEPSPWQTDTCIGAWHYQRSLFENHRYQTAETVIGMLVDIVSKNGNLLLSIPLRGDGTLDADEVKFLEEMAQWMEVNGEGIFGTRPWKVFGEGASGAGAANPIDERARRPYTAQDIRFTTKGGVLYAFCLAWPAADLTLTSLGKESKLISRRVASVKLLGSPDKIEWEQTANALIIKPPAHRPGAHAIAFKIALTSSLPPLPFGLESPLPPGPRRPDVIYVPTPQAVVDKMLEMAEVKPSDVVYDLGCGDGRIMVTAARKYGVKAVGFDIDPRRVKEALENARTNQVEHLVTVKEADIFTLDLREASVVTLYLLPQLNVRLMPQLAVLKPGSRIVSHNFGMRGAKPLDVHRMTVPYPEGNADDGLEAKEHTVYKWVVPWENEADSQDR